MTNSFLHLQLSRILEVRRKVDRLFFIVSKKAYFITTEHTIKSRSVWWLAFFLTVFVQLTFAIDARAQNLQWAKSSSNEQVLGGNVYPSAIKKDAAGNTYIVGGFEQNADFDPGAGVATLRSNGKTDIFFAKYDASGNFVFAKSMGGSSEDWGTAISIDATQNIYVTGYFAGSTDFDPGPGTNTITAMGYQNIFIAKYDASGNYDFAKVIANADGEEAKAMALDAAGNIYIGGVYTSTLDFDPGDEVYNLIPKGGSDCFFAKYDANCNFVYARSLGGTSFDELRALTVDASQNIYVTGSFSSAVDFDPSAGIANLSSAGFSGDIFFAKYDASGDYVFAKRIGSTGSDIGMGIKTDDLGNIYLLSQFTGTVDYNPAVATNNLVSKGNGDISFAKYTSTGDYIFANSIGTPDSEFPQDMVLDAAANIYITGIIAGLADFDPGVATANAGFAGIVDIFCAKYSTNGTYLFAFTLGGSGTDFGNSIAVDAAGNITLAGRFEGTADFDPGPDTQDLISGTDVANGVLAQYNSSGAFVNAKLLGGYSGELISEKGRSIALDGSGASYVVGTFQGTVDFDPGPGVTSLSSAGGNDIFLEKLDALGNFVFAKRFGGEGDDMATQVKVDGSGNIYITGSFVSTVDFDPGAGEVLLNSLGGLDIFFAKYDASGNYLSAASIGGESDDVSNSLSLDPSGNIILTGYFYDMIDFDPGPGTSYQISSGEKDIFIAKYNAAGLLVFAKTMGSIDDEMGNQVITDAAGNIYVTGYFANIVNFNPEGAANLVSSNITDVFLAKYTATGSYVFAVSVGGNGYNAGNTLALDADQNIYVAGRFNGHNLDDGRVSGSYEPQMISDIFFSKFTNIGAPEFVNVISGEWDDVATGIAVDASSNIYLTGYFGDIIDFDPGDDVANIASRGGTDIFLAKYDASGNYLFAKEIGDVESDYSYAIALDPSSNAYFTGSFNGSADFDPGASTFNLVASNNQEVFIARFGLSTLPVNLTSFKATVTSSSTVQVTWTTASEQNNKYFEIQRSIDGVNFEPVGRINGCGTCSASSIYSFEDKNPYEGRSFYRLKQVDIDEHFVLSSIATVQIASSSSVNLKVLNNPAVTSSVLQVSGIKQNVMATIELVDMSGAKLMQSRVNLRPGTNKIPLSLSGYHAGVYIMSIVGDDKSFNLRTRLVKQ